MLTAISHYHAFALRDPQQGGGEGVEADDAVGDEGGGGGSGFAGHSPAQPAFVVSGIAAVIKEALAHPGGKASGESAAFLRVLAEMSTDAVAAPGPAADHDGGGEGSGVDGSGGAGGGGEQGETGIATIDDAEAFHLKTVRDSIDEKSGWMGSALEVKKSLHQKLLSRAQRTALYSKQRHRERLGSSNQSPYSN